MTHATFDLLDENAHHAGDAFTIPTTVTDGDGNAKDLNNASASYLIVSSPQAVDPVDDGTNDPLVEKTVSGGGITIDDAANGELTVHVATGDTDHLDPRTYHHRLRITDADGARRTVFHGQLQIEP